MADGYQERLREVAQKLGDMSLSVVRECIKRDHIDPNRFKAVARFVSVPEGLIGIIIGLNETRLRVSVQGYQGDHIDFIVSHENVVMDTTQDLKLRDVAMMDCQWG